MSESEGTISTRRTEFQYPPTANNPSAYIERELAWHDGGIVSRRRTSSKRCEGRFVHDRFAIGFGFQGGDGECEWQTDGKRILSRQPNPASEVRDLIVLPVGCEFYGTGTGRGECLWLYVDTPLVENKGIGQSIASEPLVDSEWSRDRMLWTLISELREECRHDFPRGSLFAEAASLAFVTQLESYLHRRQIRYMPAGALCRDKVDRIVDYVESNIGQKISLIDLSELVGLTPVHFCRAFKEATGCSPHQYVIERRVARAKALIADTPMSLAEIALIAGFTHQSHLCHHFRRVVGATPGQFRRESGTLRRRAG